MEMHMSKRMMGQLRWRLSQIFWRGSFVGACLAFLVAAVVSLPLAHRVAMHQSQELMSSVADRVSLALLKNDVDQVDEILHGLKSHPSVQSVDLSNSQGATLLSYARVGESFETRSAQNFELASLSADNFQNVHLSQPLIFDGRIVATLSLAIDLWPIYLRFVAWSGGVLLFIAAVSIFLKQRRISIYFEKITTSNSMQQEQDKHYLKTALKQHLRVAGIRIEYQPIVRLIDGGVFGAELMISWRHPSGQTLHVSPADFVMLCEKSDLFLPVAAWLMETACAQVAKWQKQYGPLILCLNISRNQLEDSEFGQRVRAACASVGYPPQLIEFELNESVLKRHPFEKTQRLTQAFMKTQRLSLTLDDFGLDAQSLNILEDLNVQKININHKLTKSFLNDTYIRDWVRELCDHALSSDIQIRAEGIETQAQQDGLLALGCLFGQGPKFGQPMSAQQFSDYLSAHFLTLRKNEASEKLLVF